MQILKDIGLKGTEIKAYTTLLQIGSASVSKIAEKSQLDRSQTYDILDKLLSKGLITFVKKNNVKYFQPLRPSALLDLLRKKEEELMKELPKLNNLYNQKEEETQVDVFKGKEGLKAIFQDIIKKGKEQYVIGGLEELEDKTPYILNSFLRQMEKKKISERVIYVAGGKITKIKTGKYKSIKKEFLTPINTTIYENNVVFIVFQNPLFCIRINNKELAKAYKSYFNLIWMSK